MYTMPLFSRWKSLVYLGGIDEPVKVTYNNDGLYTCKYSPYKPGRYIVNIKFGGQPIPKAPFTVNIGPEPTGPITFVRAFGPGLEKGVVGKPCDFTVETNGAVGALGKSAELALLEWSF